MGGRRLRDVQKRVRSLFRSPVPATHEWAVEGAGSRRPRLQQGTAGGRGETAPRTARTKPARAPPRDWPLRPGSRPPPPAQNAAPNVLHRRHRRHSRPGQWRWRSAARGSFAAKRIWRVKVARTLQAAAAGAERDRALAAACSHGPAPPPPPASRATRAVSAMAVAPAGGQHAPALEALLGAGALRLLDSSQIVIISAAPDVGAPQVPAGPAAPPSGPRDPDVLLFATPQAPRPAPSAPRPALGRPPVGTLGAGGGGAGCSAGRCGAWVGPPGSAPGRAVTDCRSLFAALCSGPQRPHRSVGVVDDNGSRVGSWCLLSARPAFGTLRLSATILNSAVNWVLSRAHLPEGGTEAQTGKCFTQLQVVGLVF